MIITHESGWVSAFRVIGALLMPVLKHRTSSVRKIELDSVTVDLSLDRGDCIETVRRQVAHPGASFLVDCTGRAILGPDRADYNGISSGGTEFEKPDQS